LVGRATVAVTILLLVIVAMGLVILSPLALPALDSDGQTDWGRLSDIGQTYGAVSAVVAAIALIGVMVSLVIQGREMKQARKNARRALHVELMRMAMDDPSYMEAWGPYDTDTFAAERQQTYVNLIVAHWYAEYEVGEMPDVLLRATAAEVFAGVPGRRYWNDVGRFWRDNYSGRRARRFHQVLEETYQEAIKKPPVLPPPGVERGPEPETEPAREPNPSRPDRWVGMLAAAAGGGAVALVVARAVRRALRR
jgi:hypothetical protein